MLDRWVSFATWAMLAVSAAAALAIFVQVHFVRSGAGRPLVLVLPSVAPASAPSPERSACAGGAAVRFPAGNPGLVADCAALLRAQAALRGADALNWSADTPIALWDGVVAGRASGARRVQELRLEDRGLEGAIPAALGGLTGLRELRLDGNRLTGAIPPELGLLPRLEELRLDGNRLAGCVPAGLRDTPGSDLPAFGLPYCTCAGGAAVPDPAASPGLVSDCRILLRIMDELRGDAGLNWSVDLPIADWDGIGLSGGEPRRVGGVNLRSRGLTGTIPSGLGGLTELTHLHLGADNYLTGAIPAELGNLAGLQEFFAGGRNLLTGGLPAELGNLTGLRVLYLTNNRLAGSIPDLSRLTNLGYLNLRGNLFAGGIPSWLGGIRTLRRLDLHGNRLTGGIPPGLAGLPQLQELLLSRNRLTGCVPAALRDVERHDLSELGLPDCPQR